MNFIHLLNTKYYVLKIASKLGKIILGKLPKTTLDATDFYCMNKKYAYFYKYIILCYTEQKKAIQVRLNDDDRTMLVKHFKKNIMVSKCMPSSLNNNKSQRKF